MLYEMSGTDKATDQVDRGHQGLRLGSQGHGGVQGLGPFGSDDDVLKWILW